MGSRSFGTKGHPNGERFTDYNGNRRIALYDGTAAAVARGAVSRIGYDSTNNRLAAVALSASASWQQVIVAAEPIAASKKGEYYIQGDSITMTVPSATYTADYGLTVDKGAVVSTGAAYASSLDEFGIVTTGGTTVTSITVTLTGEPAAELLKMGLFSSTADGTAIALSSSKSSAMEVSADSGGADLAANYGAAIRGNFFYGTAQTTQNSTMGVLGTLSTNTLSMGGGQHFGVRGHIDYWGNSTQAGAGSYSGGLSAYVEHEGTTTLNAGNMICGVDVYQVGGTLTNSGTNPGIYIRSNSATAPWQYGIYMDCTAPCIAPLQAIKVGKVTQDAAGQVDKTGVGVTASYQYACEINADMGGTAALAGYFAAIKGNFVYGTTSTSSASFIGVLGVMNNNTRTYPNADCYAVRGHLDTWGIAACSTSGNSNIGAVSAYVENESTTTVGNNAVLCGLCAYQVGAPSVTGSGVNPALWVRGQTGGISKWQYGLYADGNSTMKPIYAAPSLTGSTAVNCVDIEVTDATTIASGYDRGIYVSYNNTGAKTSSGECNGIAVDMMCTGAANVSAMSNISLYTGDMGSATIDRLYGIDMYLDRTTATVTSHVGLNIGIDNTTDATNCYFIQVRGHGGTVDGFANFLNNTGDAVHSLFHFTGGDCAPCYNDATALNGLTSTHKIRVMIEAVEHWIYVV